MNRFWIALLLTAACLPQLPTGASAGKRTTVKTKRQEDGKKSLSPEKHKLKREARRSLARKGLWKSRDKSYTVSKRETFGGDAPADIMGFRYRLDSISHTTVSPTDRHHVYTNTGGGFVKDHRINLVFEGNTSMASAKKAKRNVQRINIKSGDLIGLYGMRDLTIVHESAQHAKDRFAVTASQKTVSGTRIITSTSGTRVRAVFKRKNNKGETRYHPIDFVLE